MVGSFIVSVFKAIHKDKEPLANQQLIQEKSTWGLDILLQYLVCHFQDNNSLSLTQLQDKMILLLCIAVMLRLHSDTGALQRSDVEFTFENNSSFRNQTMLDMTLYVKQLKEAQTKAARLGWLDLESTFHTIWIFVLTIRCIYFRSQAKLLSEKSV